MIDPFIPLSATTAPGPYARVNGQPPAPVIIPGVNDSIATAPPVLNNVHLHMNGMPVNIPIPMPMNPAHMGGGMGPPQMNAGMGPPLPVPAAMGGQGPPFQMPQFQQRPSPLPPLAGPPNQTPLPPLAGPQGQPHLPMQMPNVPMVPNANPLPGSIGPITIGPSIGPDRVPVRPPLLMPPIGMAPRLPPWIVIAALVAFLGIVAEVDSMTKTAGRMSFPYGVGTALQKVIVLATLAGGVGLIFLMSYYPFRDIILTTVPWRQNPLLLFSNPVHRFRRRIHK